MIVFTTDAPYNAAPGNTDAQNRTAYQAAIAAADAAGGGLVINPPGISYGYVVHDPTTHPDLSACVNDMVSLDLGPGDSYAPPAKDGSQRRWFWHTVQTTPVGQHDGNISIEHAFWSLWKILSNNHPRPGPDASQNEKDEYELRATFATAIRGAVVWAWGQGGYSGVQYDDYELTPFTLHVSGLRDLDAGAQSTVLQIDRLMANVGWWIGSFTVNYRPGTSPYNVWRSTEDVTVSTYWENLHRSAQLLLRESTNGDYLVFALGGSSKLALDQAGNLYPCNDNAVTCGKSGNRWQTIYLTSSPNVSSDERRKEDIRDIDDKERHAASIIAQSMKSYRRNGSQKRSIGPIAQDIVKALADSGLKPDDYDMVTTGDDGMLGVDLDQIAMFCIAALA